MNREKYPKRLIRVVSQSQKDLLHTIVDSLPIDAKNPVNAIFGEEIKVRKPSQNALMWANQLKDIAEQAYSDGRTFSDEVWHEFLKREYLPEEFDSELTKEGYVKWGIDPRGNKILVGSTTQLTVKGFSQYLMEIEAYAATEHGVIFTDRTRYAI